MGRVLSICLVAKKGGRPIPQQAVKAVAHHGLEGDRYFGWSRKGQPFPQGAITLIEAETLSSLEEELGMKLAEGETRRNVTTHGIRLNDFVGKTLRIGAAVIRGFELCDPCRRLERLSGKPLMAPLQMRGGLRAYIVKSGRIEVGDPIEAYSFEPRVLPEKA